MQLNGLFKGFIFVIIQLSPSERTSSFSSFV